MKLNVNVKNGYQIIIDNDLLVDTAKYIKSISITDKVAILSDDVVYPLYGEFVKNSLTKKGYNVSTYYFNHGESNKNLSTYQDILNFLAENEFTRNDLVIALGGGVVGDMVGFAAATFLRGVKYVQIPTTLLSAVDSSVGGKTAVDLTAGKNLVGAFYQPSLVLIDVSVIKNLPEHIFYDGMGEVLKYALLDKKVYDIIIKKDYDLKELIYLCIDYKRQIVEEDELEKGNRKLLNLGHTPAHAIELLSNYSITHGRAVRAGLKIMLNHALKTNAVNKNLYDDMLSLIGSIDINYTAKDLADASKNDKKRSGDQISMIKIYGVGNCKIEKVALSDLQEVYS